MTPQTEERTAVAEPGVETPLASRTPSPAPKRVLIRPRSGWVAVDWRELWEFRELLFFLTWRDIKVRYKQTVLGAVWAVLQPVVQMVLLTAIFGRFSGMKVGDHPYAVMVYAALIPWNFFQMAVSQGGQSLVNQQHLLTKIYLPRLFVPSSSVMGGFVDMLISLGVYTVILIVYQSSVDWQILLLAPLTLLAITAALGFSFLLSALTVTYRDFRYVIPFMVQAMMFLSPVIYPLEMFDAKWHWLLAINPMAGIIEGYRSAVFVDQPWNFTALGVSTLSTLVVFFFGCYYFRSTERRFADIA